MEYYTTYPKNPERKGGKPQLPVMDGSTLGNPLRGHAITSGSGQGRFRQLHLVPPPQMLTELCPYTTHQSLTNFITKCCIAYTPPWAGFKITTLVVIGTDYIGSCKATTTSHIRLKDNRKTSKYDNYSLYIKQVGVVLMGLHQWKLCP